METRHYLWLAVGALGFATGLTIPKMRGTPSAQAAGGSVPTTAAPAKTERGGNEGNKPVTIPALAALPPSTDTIESLLALKGTDRYTRTGLWLLDATEEDMAALWKAHHEQSGGQTDMWLKDLIFTQWAKKDPRGLLEAAKRDGEEGPAWWAWTMSDPDAALAAVKDRGDAMRNFALRGFGNFHPKRALKMLEEDPSLANQFNMRDLAEHVGRDDPRAGIEFLKKYSRSSGYDMEKIFRDWTEKNPHEAFAWLSEGSREDQQQLRKAFYDTVAQENPEAFAELAAGMPSGSLKRDLESRAFEQLASSDPDKALEEARKQDAPLLAAQRLAQVGKQLVADDPTRALETLNELLERCPEAVDRMNWVRYPNGASGGSGGVPQVGELVQSLAAWNPQQTMEQVLQSEKAHPPNQQSGGGNGPASSQVANVWLAQDAAGYATWLGSQDEETRTNGASNASNYFSNRQDYRGAADWALKVPEPQRQSSFMGNALSQWASRDQAAAAAWLAQAPISAEQRADLQRRHPNLTKPVVRSEDDVQWEEADQ